MAKKKGRHYSELKDHKLKDKVLTPPLAQISGMQLVSWRDERLPELLWAGVMTRLPRDRYLGLLRDLTNRATEVPALHGIRHSDMAKLSLVEFETLFKFVLSDKEATSALAPLTLLDQLPDRSHWVNHVPDIEPDIGWQALADLVLNCLDHQSEASTDLRWAKVRFLIVQGRMHLPQELADEIRHFPERGDLRKVRPMIRSSEGAVDTLVKDSTVDDSSDWPKTFWNSCFRNTQCVVVARTAEKNNVQTNGLVQACAQIYDACCRHFMSTLSTTAADARHDAVFGLALYGMVQLLELLGKAALRPSGRLILRSLVEAYLTLAYLVRKDEPGLWAKYRAYGSGQAKLAFLKLIDARDLPAHVDLATLEQLANEDVWQEFIQIELGHWANKDLRKISEEVGAKDIYDKYYGWPSTFVHAHWAAVRNTVFHLCVNPLHRLHRLPGPPLIGMNDVSLDGIKLVNLLLELVNQAYPTFKSRLRIPVASKVTEAGHLEGNNTTPKPIE